MNAQKKKDAARGHALRCLTCLPVVVRYKGEIDQAIEAGNLPDALASKIRAQLCELGAAVFDEIMEVRS